MRQHTFTAHSFTHQFPINTVSKLFDARPTSTDPTTAVFQAVGDNAGVFIYHFGALTFWNCDAAYISAQLEKVKQIEPDGSPETYASEYYSVEETPNAKPLVKFHSLVIDELTRERAEVVALTLAQSAAMELYERKVDQTWAKVNNLVDSLRKRGRVSPSPRRFHRLIADAVVARSSVVGVLHLLDRPDLIWEDPTMDSVYADLRTSFDLDERFRALQYKLENVQDSLEIIIDIARDGRLFLLEAAIVALILIDIILTIIKW